MTPDELEAKFSAFEKKVEDDPIFAVVLAMVFAGVETGRDIIDAIEADPYSRDEYEKAGGLQAVHDRLHTLSNDARALRDLTARVLRERAAGSK